MGEYMNYSSIKCHFMATFMFLKAPGSIDESWWYSRSATFGSYIFD